MANKRTKKKKSTKKSLAPNKKTKLMQGIASDHIQLNDTQSILSEALKAFESGDCSKTISLLEGMNSSEKLESLQLMSLSNRLLAFAYIHEKRYLDAERVIENGLTIAPACPDLLYARTFLNTTMREFTAAIDSGRAYLKAVDSMASEGHKFYQTITMGHRSQLFNFMATAYRETGDLPAAEDAYEESIKSDPRNNLPYLNYAGMLAHEGRFDEAQKIVDRGMDNCSQVSELRILLDGYRKKVTISACMIVKDEEEMLEDCLKSIRNWVDEIIIVDTGSTDRTIEIAQSYGARIFHQKWENNFSKARNYSLEQATSDWLFIIDADERIYQEDIPQIVRFVNDDENKLISLNVINVYGENEETTTFLPSERFFRRELNLRYEGIVHNQLEVPKNIAALRTPVRLKHYGYGLSPEKMRAKLARSRVLLEEQLNENPENAFAHFNLAQLLRAGENGFPVENAPLIIEHAMRGVELTDPNSTKQRHIHLMCLDQIAWAYFYTGEYDKAESYSRQAIEIKEDYLDPILLLGHIRSHQERFAEALIEYQDYINTQSHYDPSTELSNIILFHVDSRAQAYYSMAICSLALNKRDNSIEFFRLAARSSKAHLDTNVRLGKLLLEDSRFDEAALCFQQQLDHSKERYEAALGLGAIMLHKEDYLRAEECFRIALEDRPDDPHALSRLSKVYVESGRGDDAVTVMEKAAHSGKDHLSVRKLAETYYESGDYVKAAKNYKDILKSTPESSDIHNDLGNCYFKRGMFSEAEESYKRALNLESPPKYARRNLGLAQLRNNKLLESIKSLEMHEIDSPEDLESVSILADLYIKSEQYSKAIQRYEGLLTKQPEHEEALFGISECYLLMGHEDSAILGYQRLLKINPSNKAAASRLASISRTVQPA